VALNGVVFDGCRESDGTMLEAKGPGYAWAMRGPDQWMRNYDGLPDIMKQAQAQSEAAAGRAIEWHFAEQPVADYFRKAFADEGWSNITVLYTPYAGGN
jgi:Restriction endonuclease fold toxin 5